MAFTVIGEGYLRGTILGEAIFLHRAAAAMTWGDLGHDRIHHVNGVRTDNRLLNLQRVPRVEGGQDRVRGVTFDTRRQRWRARVSEGGRRRGLGQFATMGEAVAARIAAERPAQGGRP